MASQAETCHWTNQDIFHNLLLVFQLNQPSKAYRKEGYLLGQAEAAPIFLLELRSGRLSPELTVSFLTSMSGAAAALPAEPAGPAAAAALGLPLSNAFDLLLTISASCCNDNEECSGLFYSLMIMSLSQSSR